MSDWGKASKTLYCFINGCNCMTQTDDLGAINAVSVGDKLNEENISLKWENLDLNIAKVKAEDKLEAIRKLCEGKRYHYRVELAKAILEVLDK
jgi:hypothetical protein